MSVVSVPFDTPLQATDRVSVTLSSYTKDAIPIFLNAHCSTCDSVIRGPSWRSSAPADEKHDPNWRICESCYLKRYQDKPHIYKVYKHCVLDGSITSSLSHKICHCAGVAHSDTSGRSRNLFPIAQEDAHLAAPREGGLQCPLLSLGDMVAESKYDGMQTLVTQPVPLAQERHLAALTPSEREKLKQSKKKATKFRRKKNKDSNLQTTTMSSMVDEKDREGIEATSAEVREAEADEDIPFFMRRYVEKYPFGNVHMALRVGPLVIENGVAQYVTLSC